MRALLDEQLPVELAGVLSELAPQHTFSTVAAEGWKGTKNGELLRRMRDNGFAVLITLDRRMEYQQNVWLSGVGVVVLHARRSRVQELTPLAPSTVQALEIVRSGEVIHIR